MPTKSKVKEEIIERIVYSGTNSKVVYNEVYRVNGVVLRIRISTDFCNTFGAFVEQLDKETGKWNELYKLHKSLLNVYKEPDYAFYCNSNELKNKENLYMAKFSKDVESLKEKATQLLF